MPLPNKCEACEIGLGGQIHISIYRTMTALNRPILLMGVWVSNSIYNFMIFEINIQTFGIKRNL
jgi:hypothetical protein